MSKTKNKKKNYPVSLTKDAYDALAKFCDSRRPVAWSYGVTASCAIEEFLKRNAGSK